MQVRGTHWGTQLEIATNMAVLGLEKPRYSPKNAGLGDVAQLGERRVRNAKVGSSILLGSTISILFS